MTDTIAPALTPEEWDQWKHGERYIFGASDTHMLNRRAFEGTRQHATMALANAALPDDDPRKITRAWLEELRKAAHLAQIEARELGRANLRESAEKSAAALDHIADVLAALLPP